MPPRQGNLAVRLNCRGTPYAVGKPLPSEKRKMILDLHLVGQRCVQISNAVDVTHGLVSKLVKRYKQTGSMDPWSQGSPRRRQKKEGLYQIKYSTEQLAALQAVYDVRRYPLPEDLKQLSSETGLASSQVRIWFSNRRYRSRPSTSGTSSPISAAPSSSQVTSNDQKKRECETKSPPNSSTAPILSPVPSVSEANSPDETERENAASVPSVSDGNQKSESAQIDVPQLPSTVESQQPTSPTPVPAIATQNAPADLPSLYADTFRLSFAVCARPLSVEAVLLCARRADYFNDLMKLPALQRPTLFPGVLTLRQCLEELQLQIGLDKLSVDLLVALYLSTPRTR